MKPLKLAATAFLLACLLGGLWQTTQAQTTKQTKQQNKASVKKTAQLKPDEILPYKEITLKKGKPEKGYLNLHVFKPEGHQASDQSPAIVFFNGGAWAGGLPKQFYNQARFFADNGFVAIPAEYRVKKRNNTTPYECVEDGKSAIRWVRKRAKELGIDPDKIVAAGGSAGGHIAACTGIIEGHEDKDEDLNVSSVPNAMVLFNPVIDTTKKGFGSGQFAKNKKTELSPVHHVRAAIVPTIVFHGTADTTVPFENAERFARLMKKAGNTCELVSFEGRAHSFFNNEKSPTKDKDTSDQHVSAMQSLKFLNKLGFEVEN